MSRVSGIRTLAQRTAPALAVVLVLVAVAAAAEPSKASFPSQTVFAGSGRASLEPGKAHTYRIPALAVTTKGAILAFAEARRAGGGDTGHIDVVVRRSEDGGKTWGPEQTIVDQGQDCSGNPCPVVLASGRILLLTTWNAARVAEAKVAVGLGKDSRRVFLTSSDDEGKNWQSPREITAQAKRPDWSWYATGPGAGIQLTRGRHRGRVVVPCDHKAGQGHFSHILYSDDQGETWQIGAVSSEGLNECEAVELSDGDVMVNSRNHGKSVHHRGVSVSHDGGATFDPRLFRRDETLVEPQCQASIRRYSWPQGDRPGLVLFSNPATKNSRTSMTLRGSCDDGRTWAWSKPIYAGPSAYSDLAVLGDGRIGLLFEKDGYKTIEFVVVRLAGNEGR